MQNSSFWNRFNPVVPRSGLLLLAGLMWSGVGLMLCSYAYGWLTAELSLTSALLAGLGLALAAAAGRFAFIGLARKNIARILQYEEKVCLFAFQAWKSYLIIVFMVALGLALRASPLPKPYLAVVYTAIGGALLLASLNYYAHLFRRN